MRSGVWQATRSRSATRNRSTISCRLVWCWWIHPFFCQSSKLAIVTNQEDLRALENCGNEVLPCGKFTRKLVYAVDGRVHLTADVPLSSLQGGYNVAERDVANYHHIDIAALRFASIRNR